MTEYPVIRQCHTAANGWLVGSIVTVSDLSDNVGDNEGYLMNIYLRSEFYTKTFYKPSMFVFSMPTSNY